MSPIALLAVILVLLFLAGGLAGYRSGNRGLAGGSLAGVAVVIILGILLLG